MSNFIRYFFEKNQLILDQKGFKTTEGFEDCNDDDYNCQIILSNNELDIMLTRDKGQFFMDFKSNKMSNTEWVNLGLINHILGTSQDFNEMVSGDSIDYFNDNYEAILSFFDQELSAIRTKVNKAKAKRAKFLFG